MIKFFRRIRQKLLSENRFAKYLLYAIGEIVLVVIGILIALAINDRYEQTKSTEKLNLLLEDVRDELAVNIDQASSIAQYYSRKDSLIALFLNNEIPDEEFESNTGVRLLIANAASYVLKGNAFDRLMANSDDLPSQYDSLVDLFKTIYVDNWDWIRSNNEIMAEEVGEYLDQLKRTKPWYAEWVHSPVVSTGFTEHIKTDPVHRNHVASYWDKGINNHLRSILSSCSNAYEAYLRLSRELNLPDELTPSLMQHFDLAQCPGHYQSADFSVYIREHDGRLQLRSDERNQEIFPIDESLFVTGGYPWFCRFTQDEKGTITGLNIRSGYNIHQLQKQ